MTPNWAGPVGMSGSPRTATRVTPGANCLSSSSHFPLMLYSNSMKPVALPPGCARLSTNPPDWIGDDWKYDRHGPRRLRQCPYRGRARRENDVRRERHQFCRLSANLGGIGRGPVDVDPNVAAVDPAQFLQRPSEGGDPGLIFRVVLGDGQENTD